MEKYLSILERSHKIKYIFIFIIVLAIVMVIGVKKFDKKIGGNATNGYIENEMYFVKDDFNNIHQVSKYIWYTNYIFSVITIIFFIIASIIVFASFIRYVILPIYRLNYGARK